MNAQWPPERFGDIAHSDLARSVFELITDPKTVAELEKVSDLRRPAVEALVDPLQDRFGPEFSEMRQDPDRVKELHRIRQCAGKIVFDVLTSQGWTKEKDKVQLAKAKKKLGLFVTGARYIRSNTNEQNLSDSSR